MGNIFSSSPSSASLLSLPPKLPLDSLQLPDLYKRGEAVRIVAVSDTHNRLDAANAASLPVGDVLIFCGDATDLGTLDELKRFNDWLGLVKDKFEHVCVIGGNHDVLLEPETYEKNVSLKRVKDGHNIDEFRQHSFEQHREFLRNVVLSNATHYLENETIALTIKRANSCKLTVCGSPVSLDNIPAGGSRAFACDEERVYATLRKALPTATTQSKSQSQSQSQSQRRPADVLVVHGPPRGVLDTFWITSVGSASFGKLLVELDAAAAAPLVTCFGHVHAGRGAVRDVPCGLLDKTLAAAAASDEHAAVKPFGGVLINASMAKGEVGPQGEGLGIVIDVDCARLR